VSAAEFIAESLKTYAPDVVAQSLVDLGFAKSFQVATQMVAEEQSASATSSNEQSSEKAASTATEPQPEQSIPQTAEPARQNPIPAPSTPVTADGGNVSAVERSESERACPTPTHPMVAYVNALFEPDDRIAIVLIEPGAKIIQDFRSVRQVTKPGYIERLTTQNQQRNIYVGMNPILAGHSNRTKDDVAHIATVYLDLDTDGDSKLEAINASPDVPKANFVLRSSPGKYQVIWRVTDISKPDQEALLVGLIQNFGGDPACKDCTRVLRLPGFANLKYPSRPVVEVVQSADGVYGREDFRISYTPAAENKTPRVWESDEPILESQPGRDKELTSLAGKARQTMHMDEEQLYAYLSDVNEKRCQPPMSDADIRRIAHSVARYAIVDNRVLHNGVPTGAVPQNAAVAEPVEIPEFKKVPYPVFPRWIMEQPGENGKAPSIYTGLVKPWCDVNSRYAEFLFVPSLALLLNYLNKKVRIEWNDTPLSIFMMLIGKAGRVIKSSSVESAVRYLADAGICDYATSVSQADLKTLVWTAGSTEGLGMGMRDKNCTNSVLFYDELKTAASKAKIDAASLGSVLLTLYESGLFQNQIKSIKSSFSFIPKSYVTSFIGCNTDEDFAENWASLATGKKGMDERFFFLLQPEHLDPLKPKHDVDCTLAAAETKKLIDQAVRQGVFKFDESRRRWDARIEEFGNRATLRAEKWALAFAVDMGLDCIDGDCLERGYALTQYELDVKRYLGAREAETKEAAIQNRIRETLERQPGGRMLLSKLNKEIKPERFGTSLWNQAFQGLIKAGIIVLIGTGTKSDPQYVQLLQKFSGEE
jgi:RepB DNA-primase from phage plasmid/Primase C terminal 1 (PriCT-1)